MRYKKTIEDAVAENDLVFMDQVVKIPWHQMKNGHFSTLEECIDICETIRDYVKTGAIRIIEPIFDQITPMLRPLRYFPTTYARKIEATQMTMVRSYIGSFLGLYYTLQEKVEATDQACFLLERVKRADQSQKLRKDHHPNDGFADGKLVAAAYRETAKYAHVGILTNDGDIRRLCRGLPVMRTDAHGPLTIYTALRKPMIDSFKRTSSSSRQAL